MPEGHVIHRAAIKHNKAFSGKKLSVSSPQGRFSKGAKLLNKKTCLKVEAYGKHLFYTFEKGYHLHIHLGLFGRIRSHKAPPKDPRGQVRIRLFDTSTVVDVNGPTICELQDPTDFNKTIQKIGPDLLRKDADPQIFIDRVKKSKRSIAALLMDQSIIAGIGNIFRAEILWRNRINPNQRGSDLTKDDLLELWRDGQQLLDKALRTGKIITNDAAAFRKKSEQLNIYKKKQCPRCSTQIQSFEIANRTCYLCETCQTTDC